MPVIFFQVCSWDCEDDVETRPGEHCLQGLYIARAVGVSVRSRSTTRFHSVANDASWRSLHRWDPKPLLWLKGNNVLGFPFPE